MNQRIADRAELDSDFNTSALSYGLAPSPFVPVNLYLTGPRRGERGPGIRCGRRFADGLDGARPTMQSVALELAL